MSVSIETLITSISNLSITLTNGSNLVIKTEATIPESAANLGQIMFPNPDNFLTDFSVEQATYGSNGTEKQDVHYTMSWVFVSNPVGSNRNLGANYDILLADAMKIVNSIVTNDTLSGAVDLRFDGFDAFGMITDPSGNSFFGAIIKLRAMEFYEV